MNVAALPSHVPVVVVGAGPTGLLSANLLGTYGIETLLVEQNATTSDHPKAILLDDEGLRALQAAGLADDVITRVISGYGARYYTPDGECFAGVDSPVTRHGYARRNSFLQPELEKILASGLDRSTHVRTLFETKVVSVSNGEDRVTVTLDLSDGRRHEVTCLHVLACDGARSTLREQLGIAMPGVTDARDWVVVDTVNDPDRDRFSKFFCDPVRPMVSIPAPGGGRRYEYMVMPGEDPQAMAACGMIRTVLARFRSIPDNDILRAVVYTFHARVAERLALGRIALLGDAAHLSPPFAGQGMNAGLRDAFNIAWKVKLAVTGVASPRIVDTYEAERKGPITDMIKYAVALGEIVMSAKALDDAAKREICDNLADGPSRSDSTATLRPKPEATYDAGWRVPADEPAGKGLTGEIFPQIEVETEAGETYPLDDVLGPDFALVAIGDGVFDVLAGIDCAMLPARKLSILFERSMAQAAETASVVAPEANFGLKDHSGSICLVRPDRFVAAHWTNANSTEITNQIAGLCAAGECQLDN